MNKANVEHLQAVAALCAANESSALGQVLVGLRDAVSKNKALLESGAVELPNEVSENIIQASNMMNNLIQAYEEKGSQVAKSNQTVNDMILRSMSKAKATGSEANQRIGSAARATDEIKGGVKVN